MTNVERFPSKIDAWLVAAIGIPFVPVALIVARSVGRRDDALVISLMVAAPLALVVWIFTTTYYLVTDDQLFVRSGPLRRTIPIKSITSVRPTRNPLSAPALSLDRLEIEYGRSSVLISPRDKERFLAALRERGAVVTPASGTGSRARAGLRRMLLFVTLPSIVVVLAMIYMLAQPPIVDVANGVIQIHTRPRQAISISEVTALTLEDRMPGVIRKRNGLNLGSIRHGRFALDGAPNALLYVQSSQPPFLKLQARDVIYINYASAERTRDLYERLTRELNK